MSGPSDANGRTAPEPHALEPGVNGGLRVLYAVAHPLPVSESYILNEMDWMEQQGVELAVWARHRRLAAGPLEDRRRYWIGGSWQLRRAIRTFRPAVVHAHPLFIGEMIAGEVERLGLPLTARGHVGFGGREDCSPAAIRRFAERAGVSRVWAFPHFSALAAHPKVKALPSGYSPSDFSPGEPDSRRYVLRLGTALPGKAWEEFLEIARGCPERPFEAAIAVPDAGYANQLTRSAPPNVRFHRDCQRQQCVSLMQGAWVFLRGHDPKSHPYGMPMGIAEALGSGVPIVARMAPEARDYIGPSGNFYDTVDEAVGQIRAVTGWDRTTWNAARAAALEHARHYTTDATLPQVLAHWRTIESSVSRLQAPTAPESGLLRRLRALIR